MTSSDRGASDTSTTGCLERATTETRSIVKRHADCCWNRRATGRRARRLCSIDPLTQIDHSAVKSVMPPDGVLIVDGVFAYRPEINSYWDLRVWIEIDAELSVRRGIKRDADIEGGAAAAEQLHRDRYLVGEQLYIDEVDPRSLVDVIVDNTDFDRPRLVRTGD